MAVIEKRKVDNKGRVSLPVKRGNEIFFFKEGKTFILSDDLDSLQKIAQHFEETLLLVKLETLKEWFEMVEETDLGTLSNKEMDRLIGKNVTQRSKKDIEELIDD